MPLQNAFIIDPPVGPYPYSGLQVFGYVVIGFFTTLSLVVCGLRVHSRRLIKGLYIGKLILHHTAAWLVGAKWSCWVY